MNMGYKKCCEIFGIRDIQDLPRAALAVVTGDKNTRDAIYRQLLEANDYDMGRDWFQQIYESEMSEGKRKGQHFTPDSVPSLLTQLVGATPGSVHEPTAGTGGLIIGNWWQKCLKVRPWEFRPSQNFYSVWELSDRALPLLLLNLSIRGIMAEVFHGDVLERTVIAKYLLINRTDNALGFSDVVYDKDNNLRIVEDYDS